MKSLAASVFEFLMNIYRFFQRPDKRKITIDRRDWFSKPPRSFKEFRTVKTEASGCTAYTLFANDHPDYHIIYFHGGAYIYKARVPHWYGIHYFLTHLSCAVTFVDYPLAPAFTCDTTVPAAVGIYHELVKVCDAPVTLMGDSAGAGLYSRFPRL